MQSPAHAEVHGPLLRPSSGVSPPGSSSPRSPSPGFDRSAQW
ncbi:hypothetical protein SSCG_05398 [Streptomyces clavuligerus]|nr:hypothetical protein SSCG_05398 [Streptomyces clavuligerus]